MMVAVLLYAYTQGVYSSRRIARCCEERLDFMAVTAMNMPDFRPSPGQALRVPEDRGAPQARAAIRRFGPGQRQACLPADEAPRTAAGPAYRTPPSPRSRRPGRYAALKYTLVLRWAGVH